MRHRAIVSRCGFDPGVRATLCQTLAVSGLAQRSKWRWRYVRKQTSRRARSWTVPLPRSRRPGRALWVCAWQRSGSTWLAELLATAPTTRLLYEPANLADRVFEGERAAQLPLPREGDPATTDVLAAISGRRRGAWVDQLNRAHLERHRVVKDVRALWLAGAVRAAAPQTPVVVLCRHPADVAESVITLGWGRGTTPFEDEVREWIAAYHAALGDPRLEDAHFVSYESLRTDPRGAVDGIFNYAATFDRSWLALRRHPLDAARPSATEFGDRERPPAAPEEVATRRRWAEHQLADAGLGDLYGPGGSGDLGAIARRCRALVR